MSYGATGLRFRAPPRLITVHETSIIRVGDLDVRVQVSERRRSVRLTVERDAVITATVPPRTDQEELAKIIRGKRRWLYGKLSAHAAHAEDRPPRPPRQYVSGEGFFYLGRSHRLLVVADAPTAVRLVRGRLELRRDDLDEAPRHLVQWYRARGGSWLPRRIDAWAVRMNIQFSALRVRPLGYRWGSCSPDGGVNLHWAVMQLPPDLLDYVLVHELAHLRQHDHGTEFWRRVERTMPDYQARRDRLRRLGPDLWLPDLPQQS
jgi:predicted metal-dependent hydrolase